MKVIRHAKKYTTIKKEEDVDSDTVTGDSKFTERIAITSNINVVKSVNCHSLSPLNSSGYGLLEIRVFFCDFF